MAQSLTDVLAQKFYQKTGNGSEQKIAWVDISEYGSLLVLVGMEAASGDGVTAFNIAASTVAAGTSPVTLVTHAVGSVVNSAGDQMILEVTEQDVAAAGDDLRYVSAQVTAVSSSLYGVVYTRGMAKYPKAGLTADVLV